MFGGQFSIITETVYLFATPFEQWQALITLMVPIDHPPQSKPWWWEKKQNNKNKLAYLDICRFFYLSYAQNDKDIWISCGKTEVEYEYTLQMTTITNYIQNSYQNWAVSDWKSPGENFPILLTLTSDYCSYLTVQPNVVFCLVCCAFWDVLLLFHPQNCCSLDDFTFRCYHVFRRSFKKVHIFFYLTTQ